VILIHVPAGSGIETQPILTKKSKKQQQAMGGVVSFKRCGTEDYNDNIWGEISYEFLEEEDYMKYFYPVRSTLFLQIFCIISISELSETSNESWLFENQAMFNQMTQNAKYTLSKLIHIYVSNLQAFLHL
jgi:hypothetical protein